MSEYVNNVWRYIRSAELKVVRVWITGPCGHDVQCWKHMFPTSAPTEDRMYQEVRYAQKVLQLNYLPMNSSIKPTALAGADLVLVVSDQNEPNLWANARIQARQIQKTYPQLTVCIVLAPTTAPATASAPAPAPAPVTAAATSLTMKLTPAQYNIAFSGLRFCMSTDVANF